MPFLELEASQSCPARIWIPCGKHKLPLSWCAIPHCENPNGPNGDSLLIETGRNDGAMLLLHFDTMGHGPKTQPALQAVHYRLEVDPALHNRSPCELLEDLHGQIAGLPPFLDDDGNNLRGLALLVDPKTQAITLCSNISNISNRVFCNERDTGWREVPLPGFLPIGAVQFLPLDCEPTTFKRLPFSIIAGSDWMDDSSDGGSPLSQDLAEILNNLADDLTGPQILEEVLVEARQRYGDEKFPTDDCSLFHLQVDGIPS